ncbi:presenilin-2-like [Dermacentor albipictus]|uniref:presenilin-2-like n=1 Tax=Dermacentor albipictus TaxID=60249 RepID=UPI0031FCA76C
MAQERRRVTDNFSDGLIRLLTTTSCCMLLVIVTIKLSPHFLYNGSTLLLGDTGEKVFFFRATKAAIIAFLLLGLVIIVTVHHYCRNYKVIGTWTTLACAMSLAILPAPCIYVIFEEYNEPADIYSVVFVAYNFMALSVVVIRLNGPRLLQHWCLTVQSTFMTLFVLMFLPFLAQMVMLCLILIRNLVVAVPTVVDIIRDGMAKQRNESVESLHSGMLLSTSSTESGWDARGIKLGLGDFVDFVFYSVLVGSVVSFGDWTIVCTYVVCVLVGVCATIFVPVVLAVMWEGVPSLPVSTLLGLSFVESHKVIGKPANELCVSQVLI